MPPVSAPKGKIVRRFGVNLFGNPKFDRLLKKRPAPPGVHGGKRSRRSPSDYGLQLREKQKLKFYYGLSERQFRVVFAKAQKKEGITGDNLLVLLESRLDNVVYKMNMAPTRNAAKQLIAHGHIKMNGRRVSIPSFIVKKDDQITVKDSSRSQELVRKNLNEKTHSGQLPEWIIVDKANLTGTVRQIPSIEDIQSIADVQLVVELYSK